jgi:hypothetical protein
MMKRVTWFLSGAVAGVASAGYAKRKVKQTASQLAPANVAKSAVAKVRGRGHDVVDAVREGREAMRAKEAELRAELETSATPADEIDSYGTGRVIVLPDGRGRDGRDEHVGPRRISRRSRRGA